MGVTAGIFLASILLKEMRYLVYIRYGVNAKRDWLICRHVGLHQCNVSRLATNVVRLDVHQ